MKNIEHYKLNNDESISELDRNYIELLQFIYQRLNHSI